AQGNITLALMDRVIGTFDSGDLDEVKLQDALNEAFDIACEYHLEDSLARRSADVDTFEDGLTGSDLWEPINGVVPSVTRDSYCGRYAMFIDNDELGGSWGRNFEGEDGLEGFWMTIYGYALSFLLSGSNANMVVYIEELGLFSIPIAMPEEDWSTFEYPVIASWNI
ncbi:unnamed protein product, partial [Symbiodinium sp. KB8]